MKPTRFDVVLVVVLLVTALGLLGFSHYKRVDGAPSDKPLVAVITVDGEEYARLPLNVDADLTLPTAHTVVIRDGEASVTSAPCPDRVCARTAPARAVGDCIVCLPLRVVITVTEDTAT